MLNTCTIHTTGIHSSYTNNTHIIYKSHTTNIHKSYTNHINPQTQIIYISYTTLTTIILIRNNSYTPYTTPTTVIYNSYTHV